MGRNVIEEQDDVNIRAAVKMANIHDALKNVGYEGHELEIYLVRLLFCLFAEDTGIFPPDSFLDYVRNAKEDGSNLSERIVRLFEILNMPDEARAKRTLLSADLKQFQYINGGLFQDRLFSPDFDARMRQTLIDCCKFDWSKISPAIFGAMFQGVMDEERRREVGAHYTSEDNILKLLNPLFLDELWQKFEQVKTDTKLLDKFHNEIAALNFFDPACGCGNFLIVAYRKLRELEIEILKMKLGRTRQKRLDISSLLKVSIEQFYGIEIEDFPCEVARVGMWLADHQMNLLVAEEFGQYFARLPLSKGARIVHGNSLRIDWESIVPKKELSYILGNPPYAGRRYRTKEQIEEVSHYFSYKDIDYVACWYMKAAQYMQSTNIECAFVSTSSISQGEQVAALWEGLSQQYRIKINFAYDTFKWSNEAKGKAAVYCVIIGFSANDRKTKQLFFHGPKNEITVTTAGHINGYLHDAPDVFVKTRTAPISDAPLMKNGNVPLDGDALKIEECDYDEFKDCKYIKRLMGGQELVYNQKRYVLWLVGANPSEVKQMPHVMRRIEMCRQARQGMKDAATRKLAETPMFFRDTHNPERYIAIPMVSSDRRKYIPMMYLNGDTIPTNQVQTIPNATLYHFGILTSIVHMAWMRTVCGRLGVGYRYSKDIVYNNFLWAEGTEKQKAEIETLAQGVLGARAKFPESSLADLYDPLTMPKELLKAHERLDRAVLKLYGFGKDLSNNTEPPIVAELMSRYQTLCEKK